MHALTLICLVVAAVCFALAAASVTTGRLNLVALGLLAYMLVPLAHAVR